MNHLDNLWLHLEAEPKGPLFLLNRYCQGLERHTSGVLKGEVKSLTGGLAFLVVDTTVDDYCYEILRLEFDVDQPYPVKLIFKGETKRISSTRGLEEALGRVTRDRSLLEVLSSRLCLAHSRKSPQP